MVPETIAAILWERDPQKLATQIDFPHTYGKRKQLMTRVGGGKWAVNRYPCRMCKQSVLGIFFDGYSLHWATNERTHNNNPPPMACLGCKLTVYLDHETDHYKALKRKLIEKWLLERPREWIENDLPKALADERFDRAYKMAKILDARREQDLAAGMDKLKDEVQRPKNRGMVYAPMVGDKDRHRSPW